MSASRPLPNPDALTRPYWEGAKARRLMLPRCDDCNRWHFYPRSVCPHCGSTKISWHEACGEGTIYSFTEVHRAPSPAFESGVPYVVAIVALSEGPHLMASVVNNGDANIRIDALVRVDFIEDGDTTLPIFRLTKTS